MDEGLASMFTITESPEFFMPATLYEAEESEIAASEPLAVMIFDEDSGDFNIQEKSDSESTSDTALTAEASTTEMDGEDDWLIYTSNDDEFASLTTEEASMTDSVNLIEWEGALV